MSNQPKRGAHKSNLASAVELVLPVPPSLNAYYRHDRGRTHINGAGRAYRSLLSTLCSGRPALRGRLAVDVELWPPDNRRRDLDNTLKCLLDGLAIAGVFVDDGQIDDLRVRRKPVDKLAPRVVVRISEVSR